MSNPDHKKPHLFDPQDTSIKIREPDQKTLDQTLNQWSEDNDDKISPPEANFKTKLVSIGSLFIASIIGLIGLWMASLILTNLETLFNRQDTIGLLALGLAIIASTTFIILISREVIKFWQLKNLAKLQSTGREIFEQNKLRPAKKYTNTIKSLYEGIPEHRWKLDRLNTLETEIMDGRELMELLDKELGTPLDEEVKSIIAKAAKKVSLITAVTPGPFLDMAAVAYINLDMIKKISTIYGVRPGLWGLMRLARNVIAHLALSGGVAVTSDLLHPLIGTGLVAKLSRKLGEGLFNGALTIRIGLSAVSLTRPIPNLNTSPLKFAEIATLSITPKSKS